MRKLKYKPLLTLCYLLCMGCHVVSDSKPNPVDSQTVVQDSIPSPINGIIDPQNSLLIGFEFQHATDPEKRKLLFNDLNPFAKVLSKPVVDSSENSISYNLNKKESKWILSFFTDQMKATGYDTMNIHLKLAHLSTFGTCGISNKHFAIICLSLDFSEKMGVFDHEPFEIELGTLSKIFVFNELGEKVYEGWNSKGKGTDVSDDGRFIILDYRFSTGEGDIPLMNDSGYRIMDLQTGKIDLINTDNGGVMFIKNTIPVGDYYRGKMEVYYPAKRTIYSKEFNAIEQKRQLLSYEEDGLVFKGGIKLLYERDFNKRTY